MTEELQTVRQYAKDKGLKLNTVKGWVLRGQLPTVVIAGRTFVHRNARPTHDVRVSTLGRAR